MSIPLTNFDLSTLTTVGSKGFISLNNVGVSAGGVSANPSNTLNTAMLALFNDSGSGLTCFWHDTGKGFKLPAGAWVPNGVPIPLGVSQLDFQVDYLLPNPPVQVLMAVYYMPQEPINTVVALGNSPIGISGAVQVSSVSTLSNEGSAATSLVIDIGDSNFTQLLTINNDGTCVWSVDAAGVKHQVFKVNNAANFLQLSQASDTAEILGNVQVDGTSLQSGAVSMSSTLNVTGASTLTNGLASTGGAQTITGNANGSLHIGQAATGDTIDTTSGASGNTYLKSPNSTGTIVFQVPNGTEISRINSSGYNQTAGTLALGAGTKLQLITGSLTRFTGFSGTGNGTFNTNLGTTPNQIAFNPCNVSGSSQTIGGTNAQSSVVTTGAGLAWGAMAFKDV